MELVKGTAVLVLMGTFLPALRFSSCDLLPSGRHGQNERAAD